MITQTLKQDELDDAYWDGILDCEQVAGRTIVAFFENNMVGVPRRMQLRNALLDFVMQRIDQAARDRLGARYEPFMERLLNQDPTRARTPQ